MKSIQVLHIDAFTTIPNKGNPAGVVIDAAHLSEQDMQEIAYQVGFNETSFVWPSDKADLRIRYFTPGHEMDLCGHATIATLYALKEEGFFQGRDQIKVETNVGVLPMTFAYMEDGRVTIQMSQAEPAFIHFNGDVERLAASIGLCTEDIDSRWPIVYGSTGIWTVIIPVKKLERFADMIPHNEQFPDILQEMPRASLHPFCLETVDPQAFMHARHYSSVYSGTVEDPATGTASGVLGAYYLTYIQPERNAADFLIEQGLEIGHDARIQVSAVKELDHIQVSIIGTAVRVKEMQIEYGIGPK